MRKQALPRRQIDGIRVEESRVTLHFYVVIEPDLKIASLHNS